jgi:hypothetical protein
MVVLRFYISIVPNLDGLLGSKLRKFCNTLSYSPFLH